MDLVSRGVRVGILSLAIIVSMMCNGLQSVQHRAVGMLYATSESTQAVYLRKKPIHALCYQARQNTAYLAYAAAHYDGNNNQQSFDSSLLPPGFCDDFSPRGLWEELFPGDRSYDAYSWNFARVVADERAQGNNVNVLSVPLCGKELIRHAPAHTKKHSLMGRLLISRLRFLRLPINS